MPLPLRSEYPSAADPLSQTALVPVDNPFEWHLKNHSGLEFAKVQMQSAFAIDRLLSQATLCDRSKPAYRLEGSTDTTATVAIRFARQRLRRKWISTDPLQRRSSLRECSIHATILECDFRCYPLTADSLLLREQRPVLLLEELLDIVERPRPQVPDLARLASGQRDP